MMGWLRAAAPLWFRGAGLGLCVVLAFVLGFLEPLERSWLDLQFILRGAEPPQTPVVLISIGEDSFDELHQSWPWPRELHARFLDILSRGHPAVIGLDVVFPEPSPFGPQDDLALGRAVRRAGNVILAATLTLDQGSVGERHDMNPPITPIREGAGGYGPVNFERDDDAVVRRANLNWIHQGKDYPSFDLLVYRAAAKAGIHTRPEQGTSLLINFRGPPRTFTTIPYYQVVRGEILPEELSGKIVLVGATSPVLHDQFPTPFASRGDMPGIEIHANVLETLIRGIPLVRIHGLLAVALMLAASLLAVWAGNRMRPLVALGTIGVVAGLSLGVGFIAFVQGRLWADVAAVQVALILGYGASVVENFIREQREKKRLARFFSPTVVTEIIRHRKDETMGSARRRITVLFSDIRGFTSLSEKLPPEHVVEILTEYLTDLTEVVFRQGGTVDKYVGDCIMALYNVPLAQPDHAARAVRTAIEFQQRMRVLSARWEAKLGGPLRAGVGINTGDAVVGTMGARQRLEYTAIGDTVNLASRLESITREFHMPIIIGETTYQDIRGQFRTRFLGEVTVKGKEIPVKIHAVVEKDLREDSRVAVETSVGITDGDITLRGSINDLSCSGVAVCRLPKELTKDRLVQLRFDLPTFTRPVTLTGQVVWSVDDRTGFMFLDVKPDDHTVLEDFVARQGRSGIDGLNH